MLRAFSRTIHALFLDESGAALAEYALVLSGLSISGLLAFQLIGSSANSAVARNENAFQNTALVVP